MKKLLNTLYVTSENSYLDLTGKILLSMRMIKNSEDCRCIIWRVLYPLVIVE